MAIVRSHQQHDQSVRGQIGASVGALHALLVVDILQRPTGFVADRGLAGSLPQLFTLNYDTLFEQRQFFLPRPWLRAVATCGKHEFQPLDVTGLGVVPVRIIRPS